MVSRNPARGIMWPLPGRPLVRARAGVSTSTANGVWRIPCRGLSMLTFTLSRASTWAAQVDVMGKGGPPRPGELRVTSEIAFWRLQDEWRAHWVERIRTAR